MKKITVSWQSQFTNSNQLLKTNQIDLKNKWTAWDGGRHARVCPPVRTHFRVPEIFQLSSSPTQQLTAKS
ncbi:MAG: hypothetical protein ABJF23_29375, partial [Bryobacteraceae bacterium]